MFLLINKPPGITSYDVIYQLRKITGQKTIGHAGTLDPFAQGLLIIAIGRTATRQLSQLLKLDKIYLTTLQLGAISNTYDLTGNITKHKYHKTLSRQRIKTILQSFIGEQLQLPPIYSAKKINGQPAYLLARQGQTPKLTPHKITLYNIQLNKFSLKNYNLEIKVHCSSGTYLRALAHDIGQRLGTGAYLTYLQRVNVGPWQLKDAVELKQLTSNNWLQFILPNLPQLPIKKRVLIFGTFDLLHPGHLNFIQQARQLGDELYIIVARDKNVQQFKNKLPQHHELQRLRQLRQLNLAHQVMLGSLNWAHRFRIINKIKPHLIALGYDQPINLIELKTKLNKYGLHPQIKHLKPYQPHKYKSSLLKKRTGHQHHNLNLDHY